MMVTMVVMMVDASTVHVSSRRSHSNAGDCDSRKSGYEFDLVHGMVPFLFSRKPILALT